MCGRYGDGRLRWGAGDGSLGSLRSQDPEDNHMKSIRTHHDMSAHLKHALDLSLGEEEIPTRDGSQHRCRSNIHTVPTSAERTPAAIGT